MKYIKIYLITFLLCLVMVNQSAGQTLLPKPDVNDFVYDYAGILSSDQTMNLKSKLAAFDDSTSTQIIVITVSDLKEYAVDEYAYKVASEWGIGQKGKSNGVLVLLKPKTGESYGQVNIQTGYGMEGVIPDILCAQIIDREMKPHFTQNDYYGGLESATNVIMALASKEYTADEYSKNKPPEGGRAGVAAFIFIVIMIIIVINASSNNKNLGSRGSKSLPFWVLMSMMGSSQSHGSDWGGFSGGGGGGFSGGGGFGGGGFGGGGASGSW